MCGTSEEIPSGCSLGQVGAWSLGVCRGMHTAAGVPASLQGCWGHWCDSVHSPQSPGLLLIKSSSGAGKRCHTAQQFPEDTLASGAFSELHWSSTRVSFPHAPPPRPHLQTVDCDLLPLLRIVLGPDAVRFQYYVSTSALTSEARLSCCPASLAFLLSGAQVFPLTRGTLILLPGSLESKARL